MNILLSFLLAFSFSSVSPKQIGLGNDTLLNTLPATETTIDCVTGSICVGFIITACVNVEVCCGYNLMVGNGGCTVDFTSAQQNITVGQSSYTINDLEDLADAIVLEDATLTSTSQITYFDISQDYEVSEGRIEYTVKAGRYTIDKSVSGWKFYPKVL